MSGGLLVALGVGLVAALLREDDESQPKRLAPPIEIRVPARETALRVVRGKQVAILDSPGGKIVRRVDDKTEFGSPEFLALTGENRGPWLEVRHTSLGEGAGWVHAQNDSLVWRPRRVRLVADLSRRELVVRFGDAGVERRISVGIGAPDTPTPPGEYYVTDKLRGADFGEFYGCCILALSGTQPNLPQGWSGGDRLAIHGSPTPTWGQSVSNGCFHARTADLRYLMKTVPLGTVVTVRA